SDSIVLLHGVELEREDSPRTDWREWSTQRCSVELSAGIGLGISWPAKHPAADKTLLKALATNEQRTNTVAELYALVTTRIAARASGAQARRDATALRARQVWTDSLLEERRKTQRIMDEQAATVEALRKDVEVLRRDRVK